MKNKCTKCGGETIPRFFYKKSKLTISLDQYTKVLYSLFLLYIKVEKYQNIVKVSRRQLAFISYKAFFKKRDLELVSLSHFFCIIFRENYFLCHILLLDQISLSSCIYFMIYWGKCVL